MGKHFFGIKLGDKRGRFFGEFSDTDFDKLVYGRMGGRLPQNVFAWHLEDQEIKHNSRRVQAVGRLPIVINRAGYWADAEEELMKMVREETIAGLRPEKNIAG